MSDKKDIDTIITKLDNISIQFTKAINNLSSELTKIKEVLKYSKKKEFIPIKFFKDFLKPQLEKKKKMTKKEMFNLCEERRKYNSYNTIHNYLYKLELNGYIQSEKLKNIKVYMLINEENQSK